MITREMQVLIKTPAGVYRSAKYDWLTARSRIEAALKYQAPLAFMVPVKKQGVL